MSVGFDFKKKREVLICGKAYPCDFSDSRMLEGVSRDFPRILQTADAFSHLYAQMLEGVKGGEKSADYVEKVLQKKPGAGLCLPGVHRGDHRAGGIPGDLRGTAGEQRRAHGPVRIHLQ